MNSPNLCQQLYNLEVSLLLVVLEGKMFLVDTLLTPSMQYRETDLLALFSFILRLATS